MQNSAINHHPFFNLVSDLYQAEVVLSVLTCFGNENERKVLKPRAFQVRRDYFDAKDNESLDSKVNQLLRDYLIQYGEFSDQLTIFLSKSVKYTQTA